MSPSISEREEYLTIIAPSAHEAMAQFKARGLDEQGYAIAGKIGRHQFALVSGADSTDRKPVSRTSAITKSSSVRPGGSITRGMA